MDFLHPQYQHRGNGIGLAARKILRWKALGVKADGQEGYWNFCSKIYWKRPSKKWPNFKDSQRFTNKLQKTQDMNQWIHKDKRTKYQYKLNLFKTAHGTIGTLIKTPSHLPLKPNKKSLHFFGGKNRHVCDTSQPIPRRNLKQLKWTSNSLAVFVVPPPRRTPGRCRIEWLIPYPPLRRVILSSLQNNFCLRRGIVSLYRWSSK